MYDNGGRHAFPDINTGGKGGSISNILLFEVGDDRAPVGGLQENYVLLLLPKTGTTKFLVTLLKLQDIHGITKRQTKVGIPTSTPCCPNWTQGNVKNSMEQHA